MSKIDKIKSYNQIILAIGSTLILVFILVIGAFSIADAWRDYYNNNTIYPSGVLATETTDNLLMDSLRKQIISINNIVLIDSATNTYLLPVRQANLKEEESVNDLLGLVNNFASNSSYSKSYSNQGTAFNNLVIYESPSNKSRILFTQRISISQYRIIKKIGKTYLLIIGTNEDSNKDKYLNRKDLQALFIYEINNQQLTKVASKEQFTTLDIIELPMTKDILGKFGLDRNRDGEFQYGKEPIILYKIDFSSKRLIKIIADTQIEQLQNLLEGR